MPAIAPVMDELAGNTPESSRLAKQTWMHAGAYGVRGIPNLILKDGHVQQQTVRRRRLTRSKHRHRWRKQQNRLALTFSARPRQP
jgi:hypothetical protein